MNSKKEEGCKVTQTRKEVVGDKIRALLEKGGTGT